MRYDKYLKRITRLNKVVNALYRLRFVVASIASVTLVGVLTFEFTKGIVKLESFDKLTYVYGDVITASSKAFANDSEVQYRNENGGEWVKTAPIYPGDYEVRGISKNGFGSETTSDPIKFTILPKDVEISISESQITYGNLPKVLASLIGLDKIDSYSVTFDDEFAKKSNVKVDNKSVVVLDKNGNDISYCYNFIPKEREINVLARPITVSFKDNEKIYDGKDISEFDGEITSGSLANGDVIEYIENESHYSKIGNYKYEKDFVIKRGDKDVTNMYSVSSNKGNLRINKITLNAYSLSYDASYNGKTLLENNAYQVNFDCPNLIEGHNVNITFEGDYDSYINSYKPLTTESIFSINITDKDGNDVSESYSISKTYGEINVSKRAINVNYGSLSKTYDGVEESCSQYDITGDLLESDVVKVDETLFPTILTPGKIENIVGNVSVNNALGEDVTDCYNIALNCGYLEVLKPNLKFNLPSLGTITYDAQDHYLTDFSLSEEESDEISEKFTFQLEFPAEICRRAGTYYSTNRVLVMLDGTDVTSCFNLTYNAPETVIKPREINPTIYFTDDESTEVTYNSYYRYVGLNISSEEMLDLPTLSNNAILDSGTYSLDDLGFDILDKNGTGLSVFDCYEIKSCNYVTINKKEINVVLPSATYVYDGTEHYVGLDYTQFSGENAICDNDSIWDDTVSMVDAGSYDYTSTQVYCSNPDNYIFVFDADIKTSTVEKRKISLDFAEFGETYNGDYQNIRFNIKEGSLASGDSFVNSIYDGTSYLSSSLVVKNKGTYKKSNFQDFFRKDGTPRIFNSYGVDVTDNYEISDDFDITNFEVKPYPLKVTFNLGDESAYVYNGGYYTFNNISFDENPVLPNHYYQIIDAFSAKRAGEYTNNNKAYIKIYDEYGADVSPNYQFTYNYWSKVNIKKADITVKVNDFTPEYDGLPFAVNYGACSNKFSIEYGSLYESAQIQYSIKSMSDSIFINDTNFEDLVDVTIVNSLYDNPLDDYNLTIQYGTCSYQKRQLYFEGANSSHTYNKEVPTNLKINSIGDEDFYARHTLNRDTGAITTDGVYGGKYDLKVDLTKWHLLNKNAGNIEVNNYVNFNFSNLTSKVNITTRKVTVTEQGDTFDYDGVTKAKEVFTISNLLKDDKLYLEVPNYKEEVINGETKKEYGCIIDMYDKTPKGEQFRYKVNPNDPLDTKTEPIKPTSFKIYTKIDGVDVDITKSYTVELKKVNTKYLNPIYIK